MSRDVLGGALGPGPWRRPAFLARLRRARGLVGKARIAAYRAIERELLLAAPIAVYGSWFDTVGYFSPRVGCRVIPPGVNVVDLAALCKR